MYVILSHMLYLYISAEYSMLLVYFHLQRHMGNFLIQVYGPCILLVVLSWVSFWLNREATADRVSLGESSYSSLLIIKVFLKTSWSQFVDCNLPYLEHVFYHFYKRCVLQKNITKKMHQKESMLTANVKMHKSHIMIGISTP